MKLLPPQSVFAVQMPSGLPGAWSVAAHSVYLSVGLVGCVGLTKPHLDPSLPATYDPATASAGHRDRARPPVLAVLRGVSAECGLGSVPRN